MGMKANSGLFKNTSGALKHKLNIQMFNSSKKDGVFSSTGHVSNNSISKNREYFYGKSAKQISQDMQRLGYDTTVRKSAHAKSKAEVIVVGNSDKHKNISQVLVSPGSKRHGDVPYVKISLNKPIGSKKLGKIKVIDANKSDYKTDGKEKASIYYRREK